MLSLNGVSDRLLEQTLIFDTGRGILLGKWVLNNPVSFYSAARRTIEGGRNLRENFWAVPHDEFLIDTKTKDIKKGPSFF